MGNTNQAAPEEVQPINNRGPIETEIVSPTISPTPTIFLQSDQQNDNLTMYFLLATIGLLLVIIAVQVWPRKNNNQNDTEIN